MVLDGFLNTGYFCSRLTAVLASVIRTLHGNFTPFKLPDNCEVEDEKLVLLADAASTAYWSVDHAGVKPGDTVIVVGCGPVGLLTQKFAWYKGAVRLAHAKKTNKVETINFEDYENVGDHLKEITQGGADIVIDCSGMSGKMTPMEYPASGMKLHGGALGGFIIASQGYVKREPFRLPVLTEAVTTVSH